MISLGMFVLLLSAAVIAAVGLIIFVLGTNCWFPRLADVPGWCVFLHG
jgi:hypothetical protein